MAIITFGGTGNNFTAPPNNLASFEGLLGTGAAGTTISSRLMLTATHVSGNTTGNFTFNDTTYPMQLEATLDDLAMWEIAPNDTGTFSTFAPLYNGSNETNLPLVDVGYGVQRGPAVTGGWLWGAGNGELSWGNNTVAAIDTDTQINASGNFGGDFLQYDFDNNPTDPNEGIVAPGDSGGGVFVLNNGVYQLAGVNSLVDTVLDSNGNEVMAALYDQSGYYYQKTENGPLIQITTDTPDSSYATRISSKTNLLGVVQGTITPANAASFPINNDGAMSVYTSMTTGAITGGVQLSVGTPFTPVVSDTLQIAPNSGESDLSSLTIAAGCDLDLTNNHLFLDYGINPDPVSTIRGYLASGYNGGKWNGLGINSSAAAANSHYAIGYADSADSGNPAGLASGQIEIKYTLYGDANLDGLVSGDDFTIVASNLGKSVSAWDEGDFNYDGVVNGDDFTLLVGNLGKQANGTDFVLPASDYAAIDAFAAANGLMGNVPEPTSFGSVGLAAAGVLVRRRRSA